VPCCPAIQFATAAPVVLLNMRMSARRINLHASPGNQAFLQQVP
jgi:hypothetical protein